MFYCDIAYNTGGIYKKIKVIVSFRKWSYVTRSDYAKYVFEYNNVNVCNEN